VQKTLDIKNADEKIKMNQNSMPPRAILLAKILTYSGTLPLIATVVSLYFPTTDHYSVKIAVTYSAIIMSFLCGIHWATYLFFAEKCPRHLLLSSNIVALLAWASVLWEAMMLAYLPTVLLLHCICFFYLLILDLKLRDAGVLPVWFYAVRRNATLIVFVCLLAIMGQL
jgi:hypothetical protein